MSPLRTPGTLVDQRFELVSRMEDRGYGESWKAIDGRFKNRQVMLKFLRPVLGAELPEELVDHVNTLRALKHGNVLAVVGHGLHQGSPFLVHEHFEGRSLGAGLDGAKATGVLLPVRLLEALFARVSAAISAAHASPKPVLHGGLNPGSVVIHRLPGEDFHIRVLDFGLHRFADPDPSSPARSARALLNLAPEQFDGRPSTEATDVFSLGALLREMISTPPDVGATMAPTGLHRRRDDVPTAVWDAAGVALHAEPTRRFASVEAFLVEVQRGWRQPIEAHAAPPEPAPSSASPLPLYATQHRPPETPVASYDPSGRVHAPSPFRQEPALALPALPPPPSPAARPFTARSAENYAATIAISDLPPDSNPWDLAFDPARFSQEPTRARSMNDLLQNIQRTSQASAPPPQASAWRSSSPPDATIALDETPDLGATIVDRTAPAATDATMLLPPDGRGFGQQRPFGALPGHTLPLSAEHFGSSAPPLDGTMVLPESVPLGRAQPATDATMLGPGASFPAPRPAPAWAPAPLYQAPTPAALPPYAPASPTWPRPPAVEPRAPETTQRLGVVAALVLVFLAVVAVVLRLTIFG